MDRETAADIFPVKSLDGDRVAANGDPENDTNNSYNALATFMATYPECAIFRKFGMLNMLNLLRLQAELHDMEQKLKDILEEDTNSGDEFRMKYGSNFRLMRECLENDRDEIDASGFDTTQYDMLVDIGMKIDEYNRALQHILSLDNAVHPTKTAFDNLHIWLQRGNGFLTGVEAGVWDWANQDDHIAIRSQPEADMISKFLNGSLLRAYHHLIGKKTNSKRKAAGGFRVYNQGKLTRIGDGIVVALSAVLPAVAILVLYFINNMIHRIGVVIVLTTVFALAMAIFTEATRFGIFSATAAFAAVEVVYIGRTDSINTHPTLNSHKIPADVADAGNFASAEGMPSDDDSSRVRFQAAFSLAQEPVKLNTLLTSNWSSIAKTWFHSEIFWTS